MDRSLKNRRRSAPSRPAARSGKPRPGGGETVELTIDAVGARGDGVAAWNGRSVYVSATAPGDRVRAKLDAARGDGLAAALLEVLAPGPERIAPPCPSFGECGGCALQHLSADAYRAWKREQVVVALARAGLGNAPVAAVVETPPGARRRAVFAAQRRGRRVILGFNARMSRRLVEPEGCLILAPAITAALDPLRESLAELLEDGGACDVAVTASDGGLDLLFVGEIAERLAAREALAAFAERQDVARVARRADERATPEILIRRRAAIVAFGPAVVEPPPGGFLQPSREGEAALVATALEMLQGASRVADLFAGTGTFAFPLSAAAKVTAVEQDAAALAALDAAARGQGLAQRVTALRRDLFADPLTVKELAAFDAALFDPPRAGARAQAEELARAPLSRVVGVSCNPATFARDARILADGGWTLERVIPVDQFLWSPHVELVARFSR